MTIVYGVWARRLAAEHLWNARLLPFYLPRRVPAGRRSASPRSGCGSLDCVRALAPPVGERARHAADAGRRRGVCVVILGLEPADPARRPLRRQRGRRQPCTAGLGRSDEPNAASSTTGRSGTTRATRARTPTASTAASSTTMEELGKDNGCGRPCGRTTDAEPVRHADGADAAAVLDRRLHRLDGGPVLRGVGHHAVPLPRPARRCPRRRRTRCATSATTHADVAKGVEYLQRWASGTTWPLSPAVKARPHDADPDLTTVAHVGSVDVYEVADSDSSTPLANEPVVVDGADKTAQELARTCRRTSYLDPTPVAVSRRSPATGRKEWQRDRVPAMRRRRSPRLRAGERRRTSRPTTTDLLRRRPGRRAGAREGRPTSRTGRLGRRGPVPGGAQPDGRRPDSRTRSRCTTGARRSTCRDTSSPLLGIAGVVPGWRAAPPLAVPGSERHARRGLEDVPDDAARRADTLLELGHVGPDLGPRR